MAIGAVISLESTISHLTLRKSPGLTLSLPEWAASIFSVSVNLAINPFLFQAQLKQRPYEDVSILLSSFDPRYH
jgi:hypothetical protein